MLAKTDADCFPSYHQVIAGTDQETEDVRRERESGTNWVDVFICWPAETLTFVLHTNLSNDRSSLTDWGIRSLRKLVYVYVHDEALKLD